MSYYCEIIKSLFSHHPHQGVLTITLSLSNYLTLSAISLKSYRHHLVSAQCWWMSVFADQLIMVYPCVRVHRRTTLMSSSTYLRRFLVYLVRLTWIVCEIKCTWPYSGCFEVGLLPGCCSKQHAASLCSFNLCQIKPGLLFLLEQSTQVLFSIIHDQILQHRKLFSVGVPLFLPIVFCWRVR